MRACLVGLVLYLVCMLGAAQLYPGGTWVDKHTSGFSFWENFWCDLLSPVAIGGGAHQLGSLLARAAFASFALSMALFWPLAARFAGESPQARRAVVMGRLCALSLLGVAAVPSPYSELGHALFVILSCLSGLTAVVFLSLALRPRRDRIAELLAALVMLSAAVPLAQYIRQGILRAHYADWLAGAQKIANGLLLVWMAYLLWCMWREAEARANTRAR